VDSLLCGTRSNAYSGFADGVENRKQQRQTQIPFGNDNQKYSPTFNAVHHYGISYRCAAFNCATIPDELPNTDGQHGSVRLEIKDAMPVFLSASFGAPLLLP